MIDHMDRILSVGMAQYNYWVIIIIMMIGFYAVINGGNLIKKLIGIAVFQTSVLLFYIAMGAVDGGRVPILKEGVSLYINPLPHVLMLTAIVVGLATLSVGLAVVVRIKEEYGTIEEDEILNKDKKGEMEMEKKDKDNDD